MSSPAPIDVSQLQFDQADRLDKALKVSGVSGREMADYLGLTPYTVSRYINRKAEVPLQTLRLWALRTGVPFEWLETGKTPGGNDPDGGGQWWAIRDSNPGPTD